MKSMTVRNFTTLAVCLVLVAGALAAAVPAQAQGEQYLELVRQDLKTVKTAYMTEGMNLTEEQGEVFWPIYRDYQTKLSEIGDHRIANIKDYAEHFENMTDDKASEIMKNSFKNRNDYVGLLEKTAKIVAKEMDPVAAARFVQVENTLNLLIELQLAGEIPLFEKPIEE
ncbi:MAG: hypothetical protein ABFS42_13065 [Candidatus Krumholzibacteriota bacterium]